MGNEYNCRYHDRKSFGQRTKKADKAAFTSILDKVPDQTLLPGDEILLKTISIHTKMTRSDAEFILQRGGIGGILQRLLSKPQENEATLREILAKSQDAYITQEISKALARLKE
ncbi:MAG: hypothetical protein D3923_11430 [Candidatus Electrothrix sp. AR3]|nr:hypothetical protein [Candidatus Electrothrix sp. AR3]